MVSQAEEYCLGMKWSTHEAEIGEVAIAGCCCTLIFPSIDQSRPLAETG